MLEFMEVCNNSLSEGGHTILNLANDVTSHIFHLTRKIGLHISDSVLDVVFRGLNLTNNFLSALANSINDLLVAFLDLRDSSFEILINFSLELISSLSLESLDGINSIVHILSDVVDVVIDHVSFVLNDISCVLTFTSNILSHYFSCLPDSVLCLLDSSHDILLSSCKAI